MYINNLSWKKFSNEIKNPKRKIVKIKTPGKTPYHNNLQTGNTNKISQSDIRDIKYQYYKCKKELDSVYQIFSILNRPFSSKDIPYTRILNLIRKALQYPDDTGIKLILNNKEYKSNNFRKSAFSYSIPITCINKNKCEIIVFYSKKNQASKNIFFKEEQRFLNSVAQIIGKRMERRKIYDSLINSEASIKTIIEKAPLGIALSKNGIYRYTNMRYLKIFGFKKKDNLFGKSLIEQVAPEYRKVIKERIKFRNKGVPVVNKYEALGFRKDGTIFPLINVVAKANYKDEVVSIGFVTDISEFKATENKLKEYSEQLKNYAKSLQAIREEERVYISRELHDNLGQSLTALKMELFRFIKKLSKETQNNFSENIVSYFSNLIRMTDSVLFTAKNIARNLRPAILDDLGLLAAIEWHIGEFEKTTGIKCKLNATLKKIRMIDSYAIEVYRIILEALNNIYLHSNADKVLISIKENNDFTIITLKDNGIGIKENKINDTKSLGIIGMKERTKSFGGEITFEGKESKGSKVTLKIPVK